MQTMKTQHLILPIENLGCGGGGTLTIERQLIRTAGVIHAYVNPATEMAYIAYDPTRIDPSQLVMVVRQTGFRTGEPSLR